MTKKSNPVCIRCDGEGPLSKINDQYFCKSCLAAARRHVYGSADNEPFSSRAVVAAPDPQKL